MVIIIIIITPVQARCATRILTPIAINTAPPRKYEQSKSHEVVPWGNVSREADADRPASASCHPDIFSVRFSESLHKHGSGL